MGAAEKAEIGEYRHVHGTCIVSTRFIFGKDFIQFRCIVHASLGRSINEQHIPGLVTEDAAKPVDEPDPETLLAAVKKVMRQLIFECAFQRYFGCVEDLGDLITKQQSGCVQIVMLPAKLVTGRNRECQLHEALLQSTFFSAN
jgi:hypothetical protein